MNTSPRRKKKNRWLRKIKRRILAFFSRKETVANEQPVRKRRTRRRKPKPQLPSFKESWQNFVLFFKGKKRRKRRKKKSLGQRIYLSWLKFAQNIAQWNQKLLAPKKRRRRRRSKQYAVYVMGNQQRESK